MLKLLEKEQNPTYKTRATRSGDVTDCGHLLLRISVDAKPFIGERFVSIINWLSRIRKNTRITLLIADTLARYNYRSLEGLSTEAAIEKSRIAGIKWNSNHSNAITSLRKSRKNVHVVWWQDCLKDLNFEDLHNDYLMLYRYNSEFKQQVDRDVERFVNARRKDSEITDIKLLYELSSHFILEETAVHKLCLDKFGGCHAYPSDQLHSEYFLSNNGLNINPNLIFDNYRYIRLKVEKA